MPFLLLFIFVLHFTCIVFPTSPQMPLRCVFFYFLLFFLHVCLNSFYGQSDLVACICNVRMVNLLLTRISVYL